MDRKAVIFDFDGTLADTFPLVVDISYELSGAKRLSPAEIATFRRLPLLQAVRALGISIWRLPRVILLTRRQMFSRMDEVEIFPGVAEMVRELDAAGFTLCVLTSNHRRNAQAFLRKHHLNQYFTDIVGVYYGNVFYKVYGLRKLLRRNRLKAKSCYYVGNETLDMHAAKLSGLRAVAATWGDGHELVELAATEPFATIDKPQDLLKLLGHIK